MEIYGFTFTDVQLWLAGIAGALIILLIRQFFAAHNNRRNALRTATHSFKAAFANSLAALGNDSIGLDTFARDFDSHKAAVDDIRPLLPERHRRNLQKAWDEYCGKGAGLGLDGQGVVQAASATVYFTSDPVNRDLFDDFKKRFRALHGCLDDLL